MSLFRVLFPHEERSFKGDRWVSISLRTLHLIGIAGLGGGFLYQAEPAAWMPYLFLTMASGCLQICLYIWYSAIWLIQLRGLVILFKMVLLSSVIAFEEYAAYILVVIVILSGLMAHAPGDVRYFSIFHGRRVESLEDEI